MHFLGVLCVSAVKLAQVRYDRGRIRLTRQWPSLHLLFFLAAHRAAQNAGFLALRNGDLFHLHFRPYLALQVTEADVGPPAEPAPSAAGEAVLSQKDVLYCQRVQPGRAEDAERIFE